VILDAHHLLLNVVHHTIPAPFNLKTFVCMFEQYFSENLWLQPMGICHWASVHCHEIPFKYI